MPSIAAGVSASAAPISQVRISAPGIRLARIFRKRSEIDVVPSSDPRKIFADPEPAFAEVIAAFGVDTNAVDAHTAAQVDRAGLMIILREKNGTVDAEYVFRSVAGVVSAKAGRVRDNGRFGDTEFDCELFSSLRARGFRR